MYSGIDESIDSFRKNPLVGELERAIKQDDHETAAKYAATMARSIMGLTSPYLDQQEVFNLNRLGARLPSRNHPEEGDWESAVPFYKIAKAQAELCGREDILNEAEWQISCYTGDETSKAYDPRRPRTLDEAAEQRLNLLYNSKKITLF